MAGVSGAALALGATVAGVSDEWGRGMRGWVVVQGVWQRGMTSKRMSLRSTPTLTPTATPTAALITTPTATPTTAHITVPHYLPPPPLAVPWPCASVVPSRGACSICD